MTFVVDIDDTLIKSDCCKCWHCNSTIEYKNARPIQEMINKNNALYDNGHTIILNTGRDQKWLKLTIHQLKEFGIKYHTLYMGRPRGVYIDKTNNFKDFDEIDLPQT